MQAGVLLKIVLVSAAMVWVWSLPEDAGRDRGPARRTYRKHVLAVLAVLAVVAHVRFFQFHGPYVFHFHEMFHYCVGSKYYGEVGHYRLYDFAVIADSETDHFFDVLPVIRNMETLALVPASSAMQYGDECRTRFTPERWGQFKADMDGLKKLAPGRKLDPGVRWQYILTDMGYNPTPAWSLAANLITNRLDVGRRSVLTMLALVDFALLIVMFLGIGATFGWEAAGLGIVFLATNQMVRFSEIGGGFLRYDWLVALVLGVCALKTGRKVPAGALMGYSTMMRVFPVLFAACVGVYGICRWVRTRRIPGGDVGFAAAFLATCGLLAAGAVVRFGPQCWGEFARKIAVHNDLLHPKSVGLENLFLYQGETMERDLADKTGPAGSVSFEEAKRQRREQQRPWIRLAGIVLVVGVVSVLWMRRVCPYEAAVLGTVLVCALVAPTRYYHSYLVLPVVMFATWLPRRNAKVGLMLLFSMVIAGHFVELSGFVMWTEQFCQSLFLTGLAVFLIVSFHATKDSSAKADCGRTDGGPNETVGTTTP